MNRHEGKRLGFESVKHKGKEITTRLGVLPAGVPNKRIRARGTLATPLIHDLPAHLSALRDWALEFHVGGDLWMPCHGRGMRGDGEVPERARILGHSPGYRLLVRDTDTDTDTYIVDLPAKEVTGNLPAHLTAPVVSKRSKMMAPRM